MSTRDPLNRGNQVPAEIIGHVVWLYSRFPLNHRDIEDLLAERGVLVSYEAIRLWCLTFGPVLAVGLRRHRRRAGGKWHLDEVQLKIKGKKHWPWRAVDQNGLVLDGEARAPRVVVTDKLASYPPALRRVLPGVEHRRHKGLNNRAENSHRPVRKRERVLQRFKSPEHAQRFLGPFSAVHNHFLPRRHLLPADKYWQIRTERFQQWREVARLQPAA